MNYVNIAIKLAKFHEKSKKKYAKILKKSQNEFPSFLSTKHFYRRRKALFFNDINLKNIKKPNTQSAKKKENNLILSSLVSKRIVEKSNNSKSKAKDSVSSVNLCLESDNNAKDGKKIKKSKINLQTSYFSGDNNIRTKLKKTLTSLDKLKLKSILQNFQKNKLTTNNLCKQEKKLSLNSLTEDNFLFLFGNYKNKCSHKKRMKHLIYNKTVIDSMPKSALISMKMMKKFNQKTNKIYEEEKMGGIKFSKNINEFRKQIINSYKDSFGKDDLNQEKMNYNNALNFLNTNQEKQIKKAYQLEKEFYKSKYHEQSLNFKKKDYIMGYTERKNKRKSTHKLELNSFSSKYNNNLLSFSKDKSFNNKEEEKIFDYNHKHEGNNSYSNANKHSLFSPSHKKSSTDTNVKSNNKNDIKSTPNNLYLNYMTNYRQRKSNIIHVYNPAKEEYNNYVKNCIKERAKHLADSFVSINHYFEYQPLKDLNSDMPHLNINPINLKRVVKVNEILKNLYSYDDDDLLIHNINKLKEELRDVELKYYSIEKHNNNNYHLSFVKNNVRRTTIEKANAIKNTRFGVPC